MKADPPKAPRDQDNRTGSNTSDSLALGLACAGVALASFIIYAMTAAPGAWWGDGLELTAAAATLSVPHPTGYPLYMMLGRAVIGACGWLTPGRAMTLFSAFLCAGSVGLIGLALHGTFAPLADTGSADESTRRKRQCSMSAFGLAGLIAVSRSVWEHATFAEVYPLTLALGAAIVLVALHRGPNAPGAGRAALLGLLCGLGTLNHFSILALAPLALFTLFGWCRRAVNARRLTVSFAICFALCLVGYSYLPIRAAANPPINWGDPSNFERFAWVVTGGDYVGQTSRLAGAWGSQLTRGLDVWLAWWGDLFITFPSVTGRGQSISAWAAVVGIALSSLALAGCFMMARRSAAVGWGLFVSIFVTLLFSILYPIPDVGAYFMIALPAAAMGWGELIRLTLGGLSGRPAGWMIAAAPLSFAIALAATRGPQIDKSWDDTPHRWAAATLDALPEGAVLITRHAVDSEIYALWHAQIVEGRRRDVTVFGAGFIFSGWYARYFEAEGRPRVPVYVRQRPPGLKETADWALAGGVIVPNALAGRRVFAIVAGPDPREIDPFLLEMMNPRPIRAGLLPVTYYKISSYPFALPGLVIVELEVTEDFARLATERFTEIFGEAPPR